MGTFYYAVCPQCRKYTPLFKRSEFLLSTPAAAALFDFTAEHCGHTGLGVYSEYEEHGERAVMGEFQEVPWSRLDEEP